jgi:hypothetical protein
MVHSMFANTDVTVSIAMQCMKHHFERTDFTLTVAKDAVSRNARFLKISQVDW